MSSWVLVAAVLQGGVWTLPSDFDTPFVHFESETACAALRDARNWIERNEFKVYECVAIGTRHSHLPAMAPVVSNPTRVPHPAPGPLQASFGSDEPQVTDSFVDQPAGTDPTLEEAPALDALELGAPALGDVPNLGDAPALQTN